MSIRAPSHPSCACRMLNILQMNSPHYIFDHSRGKPLWYKPLINIREVNLCYFQGTWCPFLRSLKLRENRGGSKFSFSSLLPVYIFLNPYGKAKPEHKTPMQSCGHHFQPTDWNADATTKILHWVHFPSWSLSLNPNSLVIRVLNMKEQWSWMGIITISDPTGGYMMTTWTARLATYVAAIRALCITSLSMVMETSFALTWMIPLLCFICCCRFILMLIFIWNEPCPKGIPCEPPFIIIKLPSHTMMVPSTLLTIQRPLNEPETRDSQQ